MEVIGLCQAGREALQTLREHEDAFPVYEAAHRQTRGPDCLGYDKFFELSELERQGFVSEDTGSFEVRFGVRNVASQIYHNLDDHAPVSPSEGLALKVHLQANPLSPTTSNQRTEQRARANGSVDDVDHNVDDVDHNVDDVDQK